MINDFERLLNEFRKVYHEKSKHQTIFEISGYPHWENVASNVLAFYLNPTKEHGLNNLLIRSLFQSMMEIKVPTGSLTKTNVFREYPTLNGGRLDILILNEHFIIGIENKINASVYNDLEDYSKTIEAVANENGIKSDNIFKIILSVNPVNQQFSFLNITYSTFFKNIRHNSVNYVFESNSKHFLFLFDFITTFQKPNIMNNNSETLEFFENNSELIDKLVANHNELYNLLLQEFRRDINIGEIQELAKNTDFKIIYRNLIRDWGVYRDDMTYKGWKFNLQFAFSPTKGLSNLYIWSNNEDFESKVLNPIGLTKHLNFKPSEMSIAGITVNKMIKDVIEKIDSI